MADKWHFEAGFDFLGVGIHMARSDSLPYGGITLDGGGGLESAGAELALNPPKPILGPLSLDRVGFSFEFNPITVINGNLKLSALEIIHFDGTMIGAWPDATHPYWFPQDGKWHDAGTHPFYDPVFGVNVGVSIDLPGAIGTQDLADGWVVFDSGGYLDIGGGISFRVLGFARVHGGIEGVFNFPDGKYMIDGSVDGHVEVVKRGDTLAVHLEGNPTTGYRWELVRLAGESVAQVGNADYQPETAAGVPRVGAPGHTTFRFRATKPGTSVVELAYRRAWEKSVAPAKAVRFEIAVP